MNCTAAREQLSLYLYGDLSSGDEQRLAAHLAACPDCRRELEREKLVHRALDLAAAAPPPGLLARCRQQLPETLRQARGQWTWLDRFRSLWRLPARSGSLIPKPVGAVALIALGFLGARLTSGPGVALAPSPDPAGPANLRVRYVETAPSGQLRLTVDETRQKVLEGALEDDSIRRLLLAAVRDPVDPGVRAESIEILRQSPGRPEVRDALLDALQRDPSPGVRLKALEGLKPYSDDLRSRQALSKVLLTDDNPGVRTLAIDLLTASRDPDVVETLQELLLREQDTYIRSRSQHALQAMNASLGIF